MAEKSLPLGLPPGAAGGAVDGFADGKPPVAVVIPAPMRLDMALKSFPFGRFATAGAAGAADEGEPTGAWGGTVEAVVVVAAGVTAG